MAHISPHVYSSAPPPDGGAEYDPLDPYPSATRVLVCEGACNPALDALDIAISQHRRLQRRQTAHDIGRVPVARIRPIDSHSLMDQVRELKHTLHAQIAPYHWRCAVCQATRLY